MQVCGQSADKCMPAHSNLLPRKTAEGIAWVGDPSTSTAGERASRRSAGVGQQATGSSSGGAAEDAAAGRQGCYITGIKQRIQAFVYQSALDGNDLGVGHLFQASAVQANANALDDIVRILRCNNSLVATMVEMSRLSLDKDPSNESETQADRVSQAVGRFHRFRSGLEEASITAVHALDGSHMLMLLQVPRSAKIPLLVLYNWHADRMLFVGTVMSITALVCLMWYASRVFSCFRNMCHPVSCPSCSERASIGVSCSFPSFHRTSSSMLSLLCMQVLT